MLYNFDELPDRKSTESIKWHYFDEDVLPMWVADMDFRSPEPVIRALQERVAHGVFGYAGEIPGLREAVVARLAERYGWQVSAEDLVFMPGVVTGFNMAANACVGEGEGVLIQPPVYMPFLGVARHVRGVLQEAELSYHDDGCYTIDWERFEAAFTEKTRMFLLCNPHNPVGRVFTREELERIADVCLRHNVLICSDEIHCDLVYPGHQHVPVASLSQTAAQNSITLMAPSKTFNIAGLACSFAVIPNPDLRKRFERAERGMVHGVNLLGLTAAKAAYTEGQEWLDQLMTYLQENREVLYRFANEELPGVRMFRPEGTYLAWLDCRESAAYRSGDQDPGDFFLQQARVGVNDGAAFGKGGKGFIRLNFGCPRSMLLESLERMRKALLAA